MRQSRSSRAPLGSRQRAYYALTGVLAVGVVLWTLRTERRTPQSQALWLGHTITDKDEARALQDECHSSLIQYHAELSDWFSGRSAYDSIQTLWERMGMAEDMVLVSPDGARHDGPHIRAMLLSMRGRQSPAFVTEPTEINLLDKDGARSTTWVFVEKQHIGDGKTRQIKSKGICERRGDKVVWAYIEEHNM